jgi:hypothetical protein
MVALVEAKESWAPRPPTRRHFFSSSCRAPGFARLVGSVRTSMPYADPDKRRQAKRESARRRRAANPQAKRTYERDQKRQRRGVLREAAGAPERPTISVTAHLGKAADLRELFPDVCSEDPLLPDQDRWTPLSDWSGFYEPLRGEAEEALWLRFLIEYEPAWPAEVVFPGADLPLFRERATEISATLGSEPRQVQLVARWRRHHPTEDWRRLRRWLSTQEIAEAIPRLWALGLPSERGGHRIVC